MDSGTPEAEPVVLDRVTSERGELVLRQVGDDLEVISNGIFLMDTRDGRSERLLVDAALATHPSPRDVLIGGLGVGFSLQAAVADGRLDSITVVEIEPALVAWHGGALSAYTGCALSDPRVEVRVTDVGTHLAEAQSSYDVVCLDVDNGPDWTVTEANDALYGDAGTAVASRALRPGGVLSVWSASASPAYERQLRRRFRDVGVHQVPVQRGEPDVVFVARL